MHNVRRLTPTARALRLSSVGIGSFILISILVLGCSRSSRRGEGKGRTVSCKSHRPLTFSAMGDMTRMALSEGNSSSEGNSTEGETSLQQLNPETTNLTIILENIEVDYETAEAPWMFTANDSPFVPGENTSATVHANSKFSWNGAAVGNGTCSSGGSGKPSRGYIDPFNNFLGSDVPPSFFSGVQFELRNLSLDDFLHINTVNSEHDWNVTGEAGDNRVYKHGLFRAFRGNETLLLAKNVHWTQNLTYPEPVGQAANSSFGISGYFTGKIQSLLSDEEWVRRLDPNNAGYLLGVLMAASFGERSCFSSNSYWISLRGFPKFGTEENKTSAAEFVGNGEDGSTAKAGVYKGSTEVQVETAVSMSSTAKTASVAVVAASMSGALGSAMVSTVFPAGGTTPSGSGLVRLLTTTAFVARLNEIQGFHTDAMKEFGGGLRVFIGKVDLPHGQQNSTTRRSSRNQHSSKGLHAHSLFPTSLDSVTGRQAEVEVSVSDETFGGSALFTTSILLGYILLHGVVWFVVRKKPLQQQLLPHAWMIYIFSIVMANVYRSAVLNSMQYLRSHVGKASGKAGFYVIAVLQLLLIGVGFIVFFLTIMTLALKRVWRDELKWVPKQELADPDMRRSAVIMGEYKGEDNTFHSLFECYYSSMAGPRVWIAGLELFISLLDIVCTAFIWNEVVCLAILVSMYAVLFGTFLIMNPFVDRIEGWFVTALGSVELVILILEFIGAIGDFETAEQMEFTAIILGFVAIAIAILIGLYCDLVPTVCALWSKLRARFATEVVVDPQLCRSTRSDVDSDWSGISDSGTERSPESGAESKAISRDGAEDAQKGGVVAQKVDKKHGVGGTVSFFLGSNGAGKGSKNVGPRTSKDITEQDVGEGNLESRAGPATGKRKSRSRGSSDESLGGSSTCGTEGRQGGVR